MPKLLVLRGPSGSGKSTTAKAVRDVWKNPTALIEQDYLRRIVLKEKDIQNGINIQLIKNTTLFALEHSFDVIMEGIFDAERYGAMFEEILNKHPQNNHFFYFDISLEETLHRHQSKPDKNEFGEAEMRRWYKNKDFLTCANEIIIPETNTLQESIDLITSTSLQS